MPGLLARSTLLEMALLADFDTLLFERGHSFEGIVVGRAAFSMLGNTEVAPAVSLLFAVPPYVREAATEFSASHGLAMDWLSQHPAFFGESIHALPPGWRERLQLTVFRGRAMHLHSPGRLDLLALELVAASRTDEGVAWLTPFAPAPEELEQLKLWTEGLPERQRMGQLLDTLARRS